MAWTSPRTWISGEVLTAALLNVFLRDNMVGDGALVANGTNVNASASVVYRRCCNVTVIVSATATAALSGGATLFTIPAGFRPPGTVYGQAVNTTTNAINRLDISTAGVVTIANGVANGETLRGSFPMAI